MASPEPGTDIPGHEHQSLARGKGDQPVSQATPFSLSDTTITQLLAAIKDGDRLPNGVNANPAKRRALLVAGQYDGDKRASHLPSTPQDVLSIYNMLRGAGYEKSNIRILCAGFDIDDATQDQAKPTKNNLTSSLNWLVEGARSEDYRYFHFSGHGDAFESNAAEGKEARLIPEGKIPRQPDDIEVVPLDELRRNEKESPEKKLPIKTRVETQMISPKELKYYNEAILTEWPTLSILDRRFYLTDRPRYLDFGRIRDKELNAVFARLPEGCTLTVSLDCCHSGRMLNLDHKEAGDGFRGSAVSSLAVGEEVVTDSNDPTIVCAPKDPKTWFLPKFIGIFVNPGATNDITQSTVADDVGKIRLDERLRDEEREMNKIIANVFSWSGCHQRQNSREYEGGFFTSAFTKAMMTKQKDSTLREMHAKVDAYLHDIIINDLRANNMLQYCQVWTSLGKGTESKAEEKLEFPFEI